MSCIVQIGQVSRVFLEPFQELSQVLTNFNYDLSPLRRTNGYWIATDRAKRNDFKYYLNVCSPVIDDNGRFGNKKNIGAFRESMKNSSLSSVIGRYEEGKTVPTLENDVLFLKMQDGDRCEFNDQYNSSSVIVFFCDRKAGIGNPVFLAEDRDCESIFSWRSNVTCEPQSTVPPGDDKTGSSSVSILISILVIVGLGFIGMVCWKYLKNRRRRNILYNNTNGNGYISISNGSAKNLDKDDDDDDDDDSINYSGSQTRVVSPLPLH